MGLILLIIVLIILSVLQKEHHKAFAQFICTKFIKGEYSGLYSE